MDIKGFYYAEFKKYAEKGMLLDMAPYLDKYGSELKRVLEDKAEIEKACQDISMESRKHTVTQIMSECFLIMNTFENIRWI